MTLQVEASNTIPSTLASIYLQRHSRDVLNQTLPPIFCVRFNKLYAWRRERLGTRLYKLHAARMLSCLGTATYLLDIHRQMACMN